MSKWTTKHQQAILKVAKPIPTDHRAWTTCTHTLMSALQADGRWIMNHDIPQSITMVQHPKPDYIERWLVFKCSMYTYIVKPMFNSAKLVYTLDR